MSYGCLFLYLWMPFVPCIFVMVYHYLVSVTNDLYIFLIKVFDELENYDVTVAQDYDDFWFSRPAGRLRRRRRRRRSTSSNQLRSKDAQFAFEVYTY